MSRFVRASKYRHVFGQTGKKEYGLDNVKITNSAWDTNLVAASALFISVNWISSGGGALGILPLPTPFAPLPYGVPPKLPDILPLARSHSGPVLDTHWSPFNDSVVASSGEDGKAMIWKVDPSAFQDWGQDLWEPKDFDPVARLDVSARRVGHVLFHPTANNVLATSTGDHVVKLWDLANPENARVVLSGHGDAIQSIDFNYNGNLLVTTCRDRKIRIFDPRSGPDAVRVGDGHTGIKGARITWMGDLDRIATTGFSKMSDRQLAIWETGGLTNVKMTTVDQSSGVLMPYWSDNQVLFLAGKGDGNIRYFEYESDNLYPISEYKTTDPQRGICFLPRRALNVFECEIARAYKLSSASIEPISFIVPRKSDSFQSDIYPPAPSSEPSLSADEFFAGKNAPVNLVNLGDGTITLAAASAPLPTRTASASAPAPAPVPILVPSISVEPTPAPTPMSANRWDASPGASSPAEVGTPVQSRAGSGDDSANTTLREENERLTGELRAAREQIRYLELQVESIKANARKAAALLDG